MNNERILILIDGSNFYHRLKETFKGEKSLSSFDYRRLALWFAGNRLITKNKYFIGVVRAKPDDAKSQSLRKHQQKLFANLKNSGWLIERGYILKHSDGYHEKGVDVHIAIDLLVGAYENLYDTVALVSSDTDLIPALAKVRAMGKKVEYIGFSHKPSYGLITHSDIRRLLTKEDLEQFLS